MDENNQNVLVELIQVISRRKSELPEDSYTASLFKGGLEKICSKVDEESKEVIKAAKHETKQRLIEESVDLIYHLLVLLAGKDVEWKDVLEEIRKRQK